MTDDEHEATAPYGTTEQDEATPSPTYTIMVRERIGGPQWKFPGCTKRDGKSIVSIEDGVTVLRFTSSSGRNMKITGQLICLVEEERHTTKEALIV